MSLEKKQVKQILLNDQLSRMQIINIQTYKTYSTCYFLGKIGHKMRSSYSLVRGMKNA